MKSIRGIVVAGWVAVGCASPTVMLVAPVEPTEANCFETCEALFGLRPTLGCGVREAPRRTLTCSYDHRYPAPEPAQGEAGVACRAECDRAGLEKVEACWSVKTKSGKATVACRYQVLYH